MTAATLKVFITIFSDLKLSFLFTVITPGQIVSLTINITLTDIFASIVITFR
jgi:hypothetical protein